MKGASMATTFEPGQYVGKVIRWALVKAKNENKTPQFAITFLPLGRVDPQNPEGDLLPCHEVERTVFRPITDKTAGWLLRDLKLFFEYQQDSFTPLDPDGSDPFDFKDKEFPAVLTYEDYEGKTRERWNFAGGLNIGEPMSQAEVRKLDALFGVAKPKRNGRKEKETSAKMSQPSSPGPVPI
jgi:hypothetical protein